MAGLTLSSNPNGFMSSPTSLTGTESAETVNSICQVTICLRLDGKNAEISTV